MHTVQNPAQINPTTIPPFKTEYKENTPLKIADAKLKFFDDIIFFILDLLIRYNYLLLNEI